MGNTEGLLDQEVLSLGEAAEFLCVSKSTMYRLLDQGKLRGMKAGKQWRFRREDLLAYMQRGPAALALANLPIEVLDGQLAAFADELDAAGTSTDESDDPALAGEAGKISQLVRRMIWLLYTRGGSDLHLEPVWEAGKEYARLRLRVDGELRELHQLPLALHEPLVLEWKQQAGLSIEERSRPQNGSARIAYRDALVPLRVSVVPALYGERLAVRILQSRLPTLTELGIEDSPLNEWVLRPYGLLLITGLTGSGKLTVQAACVRELAERNVNIMAVADPIEFVFPPSIAQLKVERFTCAEGVRAILQQDPDVIIVGELRGDPELARAASFAAETGHLVLTCQHAYDSISPLYEFLEWGVKRSLLAAYVIGVVHQQLLPRLCDACKVEHAPDQDLLAEIRASADAGGYEMPEAPIFYESVGCESCQGRGYTGRFVVHDYFTFTPALKAAFLRGASVDELTGLAREAGQPSTFAIGVQKAVEGATSLDDVMRRIPNWRT
jgi:excisionase family DNA binding protein